MNKIGMTLAALGCLGLVGASSAANAQDAIKTPAQKSIGASTDKSKVEPALIVMNARGATLDGNTLTLTGVSSNSILFADRPVRAAGHALTAHLLEEWGASDSFGKDPPNATVSVLSKDGATVKDVVVVLKSPKLDGDKLTFDVQLLEGSLAGADGPASVFIDIIGLPFTPLSFAGVARRTAARSAWYGAAAAGAAAGYGAYGAYPPPPPPYYNPYYRPPCGYYPYPACY